MKKIRKNCVFENVGKFLVDIGVQKNFGIFQKLIFRENFFISKKKSRNFSEHLCQLKIFPGFQKSHLEQRAVRLKSRKTRYPIRAPAGDLRSPVRARACSRGITRGARHASFSLQMVFPGAD